MSARRRGTRRSRLGVLAGDRRIRTTTLVVLVVIVAGGLAFRLPGTLLVVLALGTVAVYLVVRLIGVSELSWPLRRDEGGPTGWVGVAMLAHAIAVADSSPREFDRILRPRLSRLAGAALSRDGVAWDTDAAREVLGSTVHDALRPDADGTVTTAAGTAAIPGTTRAALAAATLDALDRLEAVDAARRSAP